MVVEMRIHGFAKMASRNVAFKAAKMSEAMLEAQSSFISRNEVDNETFADYESLDRNVNLHMLNREDVHI